MKEFKINWEEKVGFSFNVDFINRHRMSPKDFTRHRNLSFAKVMTYLLKSAKKSLQIECNFLADHLNEEPSTKQAMSKARRKIAPSAFQELHRDMIRDHYQDNPYHLWKGYRIFGGDGSTIQLPDEGDIPDFFGKHFKYLSLARIFQYVELTTDTIVSPCIGPYGISENSMAKQLLSNLVNDMKSYGHNKQLYVYDRGFPSHEFAIQHLNLNVDFLFRLPTKFNLKIDELVKKKIEADFEMKIERKEGAYSARVVITYLSSKKPLIILTSLKNDEFKTEDIIEAYRLRWRNEESYKFQKFLLQLGNYTGRSVHTTLQDYWSGVFIATAINLCFVEKELKLQFDQKEKKTRVNKSVVFACMREDFLEAFLTGENSDKLFEKLDKLCRRHRVPIRPDRSYPRLSRETRNGRHIYRKCI